MDGCYFWFFFTLPWVDEISLGLSGHLGESMRSSSDLGDKVVASRAGDEQCLVLFGMIWFDWAACGVDLGSEEASLATGVHTNSLKLIMQSLLSFICRAKLGKRMKEPIPSWAYIPQTCR